MLTKLTHLLNPPDHSLAPAAHVVTRLPFGLYGFYGLFGLNAFYGLYGLYGLYGDLDDETIQMNSFAAINFY